MIITLLRKLRNSITRLIGLLALLNFVLRKIFFGFENACNYLKKVSSSSLLLVLKNQGAKIGHNTDIGAGISFHNCKDFSNFEVGSNTHIGKNSFFDLREKVIISNNVVISMNCSFITHVDASKSKVSKVIPAEARSIIICKDAYIGEGCSILMGVTIGEGSIIGAKSLVKDNIDNFTMVAGIPSVFKNKVNL